MASKQNQNLDGNLYRPVWNEEKQQFEFVERDVPLLSREQHRTYDAFIANMEAKAVAEEARPRPAAELVCEIPGPCRIYLFQGSRLFIARAGQTPVELIPGSIQELKALS